MRMMKESGIEWIGEIPEKWGVVLLSSLFSHHKSKNVGLQETNLLSLSYGRIVRKDITTSEGLLPESFETYNIVDVDDIVFRLTDLQNDKRSLRTGLCKEKGIITSAYTVIRPTTSSTDSRYLQYLYHAYDICKVFYGLGDGVRQGMGFDDLKKIPTLVPALEEQKKIADFLDGKCAEIDELVQTEEKMIEELKAYKQSVITEAVTKGLDSAAPMKDSGIEWIGAIPQSWRTMPIKHCCKINLESLKDTEKDDLLINYIDISSADENGNINFVDEITFLNAPSRARRIIRKGDVIISTVRTYLKVIALIDEKYDGFICSTGFAVLTPLEKVEARFLYYNIYTDSFTSRVSYYSNGISYPAINSSVLATLHITLPSIDEQKQIADYLDEKCAKIDEMIAIRNEQIDQLKDYKKSLIYEYVTGKKEVV